MAPAPDEDPLARVREVRGTAEQLEESDRAALDEIRIFLQCHEAEAVRTATHSVLENYPDWWCRGRRAPPGLSLESESELEEFHKAIGKLHNLGIPLTLAERRTPLFRFFQELDAWGTREASMPVEELMGPECDLALLLGSVIGEVFPGHGGFLDAAVYDATGLSQTKGVRKTSLRIVWPNIVVDSERAARVRDLVVHRLNAVMAEGGAISKLEADLRQYSSQNAWHSVFGDAAYGVRSNVRMPLCDRVSPLPLRAPEQRPLTPVGVLRFTYQSDGKLKAAEWLCQQTDLDGAEWVKIGSLRRAPDVQLTEWSVPTYAASQPIPPSSTRSGRVKVRTAGGSDAMVGSAAPRNAARAALKMSSAPERAGQLLTVERHFSGSADQFADKMEQHLGKATVEADGSYVWRQPAGDARIVMFPEDQRVKVIGRPNQVRSLVVIVSPYTEALQVLGCPMTNRQPTLPPNGRAPSAAYAPDKEAPTPATSSAATASEEKEAVTKEQAAEGNEAIQPAEAESMIDRPCVAKQVFQPQGEGELELAEGDAIVITHDPDGQDGNSQDRWVYGRNEARNGDSGWFPLSHIALKEDWDGTSQQQQ